MTLLEAIREYRRVNHVPPTMDEVIEMASEWKEIDRFFKHPRTRRGLDFVSWRCVACGCTKPCCRPNHE